MEGNPISPPERGVIAWQHFAFTARRAVASVTHRGSLKEPTALGLDQKSLQAKKIFFSLKSVSRSESHKPQYGVT